MIFTRFLSSGGSCTHPSPIWANNSGPVVYSSMPNFIVIGIMPYITTHIFELVQDRMREIVEISLHFVSKSIKININQDCTTYKSGKQLGPTNDRFM